LESTLTSTNGSLMKQLVFLQPVNNCWIDRQGKIGQQTVASLSDNYSPQVGDLVSGRLLHNFPVKNTFFYYKIVDCGPGHDVFIIKTRLKVGKGHPNHKQIDVSNHSCSCLVLRPAARNFRETRTRPANRQIRQCYAAAR
jgi:hypothetical protein